MAGAANKSSVSWRKPSSCPPVAKMLYACAMARAVPTALPDGTSRLRVDAVRIKIDSCARIDLKCPVDVRAPIHCFQCQAKREADQHREPPRRRNGRHTRVRDLLREPDVDVQSKGRCDLVLEELSQAPMMRIDTPQQLAFVETKGERVIRLARAWFPRGFLACEHYCMRSRSATTVRSTGSSIANSPAWCARSWRTVILSFPCCANSGHTQRPVLHSQANRASERWRGSSRPSPSWPSGRAPSCSLPRVHPFAYSECHPRGRQLSRHGEKHSRLHPTHPRRTKFSENAWRTGSKPQLT